MTRLALWAEAIGRIKKAFGEMIVAMGNLPSSHHSGPNMYSKAKRRGPAGHRRGR